MLMNFVGYGQVICTTHVTVYGICWLLASRLPHGMSSIDVFKNIDIIDFIIKSQHKFMSSSQVNYTI